MSGASEASEGVSEAKRSMVERMNERAERCGANE